MYGMGVTAGLAALRGESRRSLWKRGGIALGLLFLAGPASDLDGSLGAARRAGLAVGLAAFAALYLALLPPSRAIACRGRLAPQAALALLGLLAVALLVAGAPHSFVALFVYFAAAAGLLLPARLAAAVTLVTAAGVALAAWAMGVSASATGSIVLTIVSIGALMIAFSRQIQANRELRAAEDELARLAVTEERLRIARDLHDLLGHTLSVIALKSELAEKLVRRDAERAAKELGEVQAVTRGALAQVRDAVHAYRQLALDDALDGARTALAAAGIDCRLEAEELALPADVAAVLAWAVREATTNVVRHSGARNCEIRVHADSGTAEVEVEDDGAGPAPSRPGSGLAGLAERAALVHGRLDAGMRPGGGFRLRLTVPLTAS
jgi:two-component system sensor histidine kinase DesK